MAAITIKITSKSKSSPQPPPALPGDFGMLTGRRADVVDEVGAGTGNAHGRVSSTSVDTRMNAVTPNAKANAPQTKVHMDAG